jgi:hypothetical protein
MMRLARLGFALSLAAGCSDDGTPAADEADSGSGTSPTTGAETSGSGASASDSASGPVGDASSGEGSGSGSGSGGVVATSLDECIAEGVIPVDCSAEDFGIQWVAYAPEVGCAGAMGGVDEVAQFLFRLDEVVDEEAQIRGLRLQPPNPSGTDQIIEFTAETPVPYGMLPLLLEWPSVLTQMAFAGGLSFIDVTPDSSTCTLEAIPAWEDLGMGATLRGTFELGGGTLTVLDEDGSPTSLVSEGFELRGCFHLPAESYVLELDE